MRSRRYSPIASTSTSTSTCGLACSPVSSRSRSTPHATSGWRAAGGSPSSAPGRAGLHRTGCTHHVVALISRNIGGPARPPARGGRHERASGCRSVPRTFGRRARSRSGRRGSCSSPTTSSAKVFAVDVGDPGAQAGSEPFDLENVDARVASFLGCEADDVVIRDMAVHPTSHNVYLSVQRGRGDAGQAVLVRIDRLDGSIIDVAARRRAGRRGHDRRRAGRGRRAARHHAAAGRGGRGAHVRRADDPHPAPPDPHVDRHRHGLRRRRAARRRPVERGVLVEAAAHPVPVRATRSTDNNLEIFHVSHGKWETAAPIRTFVPYDGGRSILASYTCTPVVHFPLADLDTGHQDRGPHRRRARRDEPAARHGLVRPGRRGAPARGQLRRTA